MTIRLSKLTAELLANNIPIDGVKTIGDPDINDADLFPDCIIQYQSSATPGQISQGNAIKAAHNSALKLGYVDATTTGSKLVGIVGQTGKAFLGNGYRFFVSKITGLTTAPTGSLGTNSPNFNDLQTATALTGWLQNDFQNFSWAIGGRKQAILTPTPIFINITVAAVATTYVVGAEFFGDYRNV